MRRRFLIECCLMAVLLPPTLLLLSSRPGLWHANAQVYDEWLELSPPVPSSDILIVGIDERSLQAIGPWPWPRQVHAELLRTLAQHAPQAVFLDMFLTTPSTLAGGDDALAQAMQQVPTYLPLLQATPPMDPAQPPGYLAPLPALKAAARGTGHVNASPDADGVVRKLFLQEGPPGHLQPYLGSVMAGPAPIPPPDDAPTISETWVQESALRIPFAGTAGTYRTVPYISVLQGEVPDELLRGKYLLVGATATANLGDQLLVPNTGPARMLPGVEVHANAFDTLRHGRGIQTPTPWQHGVWIAGLVWAALLLFLRFPQHALASAVGLVALCLAASAGTMVAWSLWLPPVAPLVGVVLAYILWGWRRLNAMARFFRQQVAALDADTPQEPPPAIPQLWPHLASLDPQTHALNRAIESLVRTRALEHRAQQQSEQWLRFLSHDLRSPQVSILSLLNLWKAKAPGMDTERLVEGVQREAMRTLELTEGLVELTSADSDNYQFTDCIAGAMVQDAIDQTWAYATAQQVTLKSHLPAEESVLRADMPLLTRAVVNLLNNAIRHSPAGGVVTVALNHGQRSHQPEVVLSVQDEGDGMTPEQLNAVLSALPGKRRRDASVRGLGLGLAVVRAVVVRHGGWMYATSTQGLGSTFSLGLPVGKPPLDDDVVS